ncbi:MAG: fimbrillin family protein [Candidatus Cryptobacteroides sp.]
MKTGRRLLMVLTAGALAGCATEELKQEVIVPGEDRTMISLGGHIEQEYNTRAGQDGFADGDKIGTYIVDYVNGNPGELQLEGNRADNLYYTYNEAGNRWVPSYDVYYKDSKTPVDIYGYYPASRPESVTEWPFEVQMNQRVEAADGKLSGYEQSDFLWAKAENKTSADKIVWLNFKHRLAGVRITLAEGSGFDDGEWASLKKDVLIQNTVRTSTIDLSTGIATPVGDVPSTGIIPVDEGTDFRAVVIPQTVSQGKKIITATVGGYTYDLVKDEAMTYTAGKQHNFTLTVNKRAPGNYEFVLSGESITAWENDRTSHDGIAREYVVINVETPGTLDACIADKGLEITKVRNMKVTGTITARDFGVMRRLMTSLSALNLKEVKIVKGDGGTFGPNMDYAAVNNNDEIPGGALTNKRSLTSLVLPDRLKRICGDAFSDCNMLTGSLIIPEGVEEIELAAFRSCTNLNGALKLPSTLKYLGRMAGYTSYWDGPFKDCGFVGELSLPESLEIIGWGAFEGCRGFYGELRLPENLKQLGQAAFSGMVNMVGSIEIPQQVTTIEENTFSNSGFNGTLKLHDGITSIGEGAFCNTGLKGELHLPKNIEVISKESFRGCDFSGTLVLPKTVRQIGDKAFAWNWRLMGTLEIPEGVLSIGAGAFAQCRMLEGVIFPKSLENIKYEPSWGEDGGAFQNCFGIGRIVCKSTIPAYVQDGCFDGVPKDNFTLEVPEGYEAQYQAATGWREFKRIAAYRNLVVRPIAATAINTSVTRDIVLTADDNWSVVSQPDWVTLNQTSGKGKTELELTFAEKPHDGTTRTGEVIFELDGKDYQTKLSVSQYDYEYGEDEVITLQSATKGNGVNIVILGDGFNAKDISEGKLMKAMEETYGHFFSIQPYKYYKDYFNVYTAVPVSPESGIGTVNTIVQTRFNTATNGGVTRNGNDDYYEVLQYACKAPTVNNDNINRTLVIMIPNTEDYGGVTYMWDDGTAIAYCPMSDYGYPLDFRGVIQHEAGGHGFGKLGDEYIYHNAFISACNCTCCSHPSSWDAEHENNVFMNLSLRGKMSEVPWKDFIFHEKYSGIVDIFEGGYMHTRGVYRSEQNSCMNNEIPYYSTISRYSIVKRIMEYAGEEFSFDKFVENDIIEAAATTSTKSGYNISFDSRTAAMNSHEPVNMGKRPILK